MGLTRGWLSHPLAWLALALSIGPPALAAPEPALLLSVTLSADGEVRAFGEAATPVELSIRDHLSAQGEGRFEGRLQGRLTFTRVASRFRSAPARLLTFGQLELPDGEAFYQVVGWAVPLTDGRWLETGAVRFEDAPSSEAWLSQTLGLWEGEFEAGSGRGTFRIRVPGQAAVPDAQPATAESSAPAATGGAAGRRPVSPLVSDDPSFVWQDNRDPFSPRRSPNAVAGLQLGSTRVMVAYGRPALAGRDFEPEGRLWRTGADEATTLTATDTLSVGGHELPAGTYSLFTIPGPDRWTVVLNHDSNQWGTATYSEERDALRFEVAPQKRPPRERLSFSFEEIGPDAATADLVLHWGETAIAIRIDEP